MSICRMTMYNKFENLEKVKNLAFPKFFSIKEGNEAEILVTLWRK